MPASPDNADYRTPGQLIKDLLDERGWTQRVLAVVLGLDETGLNKIIGGHRPLDAATAIAIAEVLPVEASRLMDLETSYALAKAKLVERPDPGRANRAQLFGDLPVSDMIKRGWIKAEDVRDVPRVESELAKFFNTSTPDQIEILPHAAKKTQVSHPVSPAQLAWLYRVRQIAQEMLVPKFTPASGKSAVEKLKPLRISPEGVRKIPKILMESGIRFVIVESLPSAKIDGVCFWLDEKSPVIGMTIRFDRIDNFWFVLRHELEHVLQGHGKEEMMIDTELEGDNAGSGPSIPEEERVANEAASEFCVPDRSIKSFIARKAPLFSERDLLGFAKTLQLHPGLIVGQLQHRTKRYEIFRKHLVKVRDSVLPSAYTDGWGNVYPVDP